jgi:hypothetical protein
MTLSFPAQDYQLRDLSQPSAPTATGVGKLAQRLLVHF